LGKTATETHAMLVQVYRTDAVSRKCVYDWFKHFREGKEPVDDEPLSGRPSTSVTTDNIERVRHMLLQNRRLSLRWISEKLGISKDRLLFVPSPQGGPEGNTFCRRTRHPKTCDICASIDPKRGLR